MFIKFIHIKGYRFIFDLMPVDRALLLRGPKCEVGGGFNFCIYLICAFQYVWRPKNDKKELLNQ